MKRMLWTTLLLALGMASAAGQTQVVFLGTGTPNADPERMGPCVAVVVNDTPYLVDFGPGVARRAAAAERKGVKGLAVAKLSRAFVTHLHSDHTIGYADLLFTPWVLERAAPLRVYGPPGLRAMTRHLLQAYREDVQLRLYGGEPSNKTGWRVEAKEIRPGVAYRDANVIVTAFAVKHGKWKHAYGYRFQTPDKTIVISGDATPSESIVSACNGCDVLVHEVYSDAGFAKRPPAWQRYHAAYHTSASQLAALATRARPKLLLLYHQLFWGATEAELVKEVEAGFSGKVVSARDLDIF